VAIARSVEKLGARGCCVGDVLSDGSGDAVVVVSDRDGDVDVLGAGPGPASGVDPLVHPPRATTPTAAPRARSYRLMHRP
jgi:hypothetical protein